ncbi:MAG: hypothetical protein KGO96_07945 [Elusimicrobia bacterium]|nr:hypothetical protein [Elusimicrobiota bacterium]MDE2236524.1 hypothetical protein [Elusimicrobiota bacterium]MDE2425822.1 hypothetical protein [Elusimicrobiota bacterium]
MPGIYRKKRRQKGPSKNEEKVERARQAEAIARPANSLASRFPTLRALTVTLSFTGAQGQTLGEETRRYGPQDPCDFSVPCPGLCGVGSFDLAAKIEQIAAAGETDSESNGVCQEILQTGGSCACALKCRVQASYLEK